MNVMFTKHPKMLTFDVTHSWTDSQKCTDATEHVQFNTRCHPFNSNTFSIPKYGNELGFSPTLKGPGRKFTQEWKLTSTQHTSYSSENELRRKTTLIHSSRSANRGAQLGPHCRPQEHGKRESVLAWSGCTSCVRRKESGQHTSAGLREHLAEQT